MECWTSWIARQSFQIDGLNGLCSWNVVWPVVRSSFVYISFTLLLFRSRSLYFRHMQFELNLYVVNICTIHAVHQLCYKHSHKHKHKQQIMVNHFDWDGIFPLKFFLACIQIECKQLNIIYINLEFMVKLCAIFLAF